MEKQTVVLLQKYLALTILTLSLFLNLDQYVKVIVNIKTEVKSFVKSVYFYSLTCFEINVIHTYFLATKNIMYGHLNVTGNRMKQSAVFKMFCSLGVITTGNSKLRVLF